MKKTNFELHDQQIANDTNNRRKDDIMHANAIKIERINSSVRRKKNESLLFYIKY